MPASSSLILKVERLPGHVPYAEGLARQQAAAEALPAASARAATLLLLQHAPVYTLGRRTEDTHLPLDEAALAARSGADVVRNDRGGSVTWHGPGQLTAYLHLNLKAWDLPIHQHLWNVEEAALRVLATYGLKGERIDGMSGAWVRQGERAAKVCAVGVSARRWVTYHGLALNIDPDLAYYDHIDPCGLGKRPVTSLAMLLGDAPPFEEVETRLAKAFGEILGADISE